MSNPFLDGGMTQLPLFERKRQMKLRIAKSDAEAPMKLSVQDKARIDKSAQMRLYRKQLREKIEVLRAGPHGADYLTLLRHIRALSFDNTDAFIDYVKQATWLHDADINVRHIVLSVIGRAIMDLRVINGLAPFDDSLPGEEPTVFEIIRAELGVP